MANITEKDRTIIKAIADSYLGGTDNCLLDLINVCHQAKENVVVMYIMPSIVDVFIQVSRCIAGGVSYADISSVVNRELPEQLASIIKDVDSDDFFDLLKATIYKFFEEGDFDAGYKTCCSGLSGAFGLGKLLPILGTISAMNISDAVENNIVNDKDVSDMRWQLVSFFSAIVSADKLMEMVQHYDDPALQINLMVSFVIAGGNAGEIDRKDYTEFINKYYELGKGLTGKEIDIDLEDNAKEFLAKIANKLDEN